MSKVSITELANVLVQKHDLERTEAELFIRQFVNVINDGLKKDKVVKVKGLGTFKVLAVSPRKSVDVNTGEAIVIEGRDKISFTAEAVMRDLVNAPFAQFETVVVNDGVDFSDIDANLQDHDDVANAQDAIADSGEEHEEEESKNAGEALGSIDVEEKTVHEATSSVNAKLQEQQDDIATAHTTVAQENNGDDAESDALLEPKELTPKLSETSRPKSSDSHDTPKPTETEEVTMVPVDICDAPETDSRIGEHSAIVAQPSDGRSQVENIATIGNSEQKAAHDKLVADNEMLTQESKAFRMRANILACCLTAVFVIGIACIYYMFTQIEKRDNRIEHLEAQTATLVERMTKAHMQTGFAEKPAARASVVKAVDDSISKAKQVQESLSGGKDVKVESGTTQPVVSSGKGAEQEARKKAENVTGKEKSVNEKPMASSAYDSDPRIRTGAYVITGISQTVTVRQGQTLSSIGKTYLGPGMDCYMEAVNGGNKELKAGDKVKIPALKLRKSLKR